MAGIWTASLLAALCASGVAWLCLWLHEHGIRPNRSLRRFACGASIIGLCVLSLWAGALIQQGGSKPGGDGGTGTTGVPPVGNGDTGATGVSPVASTDEERPVNGRDARFPSVAMRPSRTRIGWPLAHTRTGSTSRWAAGASASVRTSWSV